MFDYELAEAQDLCPSSLAQGVREHHDWVRREPYEPDPDRSLEYDPGIGVLIYRDTGNPVYPYPYQPITEPVDMCRQCGRTRKAQ